jgi:hypothetical protein
VRLRAARSPGADVHAERPEYLRGFLGSALERLYVEQDVLLDEELEAP